MTDWYLLNLSFRLRRNKRNRPNEFPCHTIAGASFGRLDFEDLLLVHHFSFEDSVVFHSFLGKYHHHGHHHHGHPEYCDLVRARNLHGPGGRDQLPLHQDQSGDLGHHQVGPRHLRPRSTTGHAADDRSCSARCRSSARACRSRWPAARPSPIKGLAKPSIDCVEVRRPQRGRRLEPHPPFAHVSSLAPPPGKGRRRGRTAAPTPPARYPRLNWHRNTGIRIPESVPDIR